MSAARKLRRRLRLAEDNPKTPAPKRDQRTGSTRNRPGSASSSRGGIKISAAAEAALENLRDEHNDRYSAPGRRVDLGMLRAVYRRGAGAFSTSHRPSVTSRNQWALGRVKAFLRLVGKGERKKSYTTDDDLLPKEHPNHKEKAQATEQLAERYTHINFSPPDGVRKAAARALEVRAEKPPSQRGMTDVGLARARDLSNGQTISPETARRMLSYFSRHEVDKQGASWPEQGKGWQAWHGWGGDAGFAWVRKLVKQMDAADQKLTERTYQAAFNQIALAEVDGLVVMVDDGQTMGRPFITLSAGRVSSRLSGDLICDVTPEHLAEIKRVFDTRRDFDPVIIDWNHQSAPGGQSTPEESGALGEIAELRLSEDGRQLIAVPVYNQRGAEVVAAAGGTLWSSPEFFLGDVYARESGKKTGSAQLLAVTLTPRPQQAASALERVTLSEEMNLMDVAEIEAIADLDQAKALLKQKDALVRELEARLKATREEMAEEDEAEAEEMAEASSDDEEKEQMGEYKRMSEQLSQANSAQAAQIKALTEQVQALAEKEATARREATISALLRSGRITPAEREVAERAWALSESGDPTFLNWINERPAEHAVSLSEIGHGASAEEITQATVLQRARELASSESITFSEAYERLNRDEPALIQSAFGG